MDDVSHRANALSRPLLIHFFTSYCHEQGTYFRTHNFAKGLVQLGHRVTVYSGDYNENSNQRNEQRDGVDYEIIPESPKTSIFSKSNHPLTTIRRYLRSYPPCDIAHLFQPMLGAAAAWSRAVAKRKFYDWDDLWEGGLITTFPKGWRQVWPRRIISRLERTLPAKSDHVTAASHFLLDRANERHARAATLVRNGYWPNPVPGRAAARQTLGLRPEGTFYAGFMGRTVDELSWCFSALEAAIPRHPTLRFALCGAAPSAMDGLPPHVRDRIDFLGQLTAAQCRNFAAALNLGLLPLADNAFNQSRYPIKFCDHLSAGVPLLCSQVGEVGSLIPLFPWAIKAGVTRDQWIADFNDTVDAMAQGKTFTITLELLEKELSWSLLTRKLLKTYQESLAMAAR